MRNKTKKERKTEMNQNSVLLTIENKVVVARGEEGRGMGEIGKGD